jgi:hypothetical protein
MEPCDKYDEWMALVYADLDFKTKIGILAYLSENV